MKLRWFMLLIALLSFALITACDTKQTAVVSLEEHAADGKSWSYTMEPENVLVQKDTSVTKTDAEAIRQHQWEFEGNTPGTVSLYFTYGSGDETANAPYVHYEYRVEQDRTVTVLGISGSVLPGALNA